VLLVRGKGDQLYDQLVRLDPSPIIASIELLRSRKAVDR
jgi:hypothetical protein